MGSRGLGKVREEALELQYRSAQSLLTTSSRTWTGQLTPTGPNKSGY